MSTKTIDEHATQIPTPATVDLKLEVVVIPVSDVGRAKHFYESLGQLAARAAPPSEARS